MLALEELEFALQHIEGLVSRWWMWGGSPSGGSGGIFSVVSHKELANLSGTRLRVRGEDRGYVSTFRLPPYYSSES
jgi:hypothetical protein